MKSNILGLLAVGLLVIADASASVVYTYQGSNFTFIDGSNPQVTTSDSITGWVEFASAPTPGQTNVKNWIAFSLSDGARTLSSANGAQFFLSDFFDFDASLNIVAWRFSLVPQTASDNGDVIRTSTVFDLTRIDAGLVSVGSTSSGGSWTAASPVPLPAAAWLLLSGLAGLGFLGRRRKAD